MGFKQFFLGNGSDHIIDASVDRYEGDYHIFTDKAGSPQIVPAETERQWNAEPQLNADGEWEPGEFDPEDIPSYSPPQEKTSIWSRLFG